jgi:hypothetical protein
VGLLLPPFTAAITVNACVVVMLDADGSTVTVGESGFDTATVVTATGALPMVAL